MQAYIGKIEPLSSDNWYGKLATVIFFAGCDFDCPNCNTPEMLSAKEELLVDFKDIKSELKKNLGAIQAVVFTGGEPCLQRQALLNLAAFAKDMNLEVGLETNGSKTECLRSLLSLSLVDQIALDIKAPFEEDLFEKATRSKTFFKPTAELITDLKQTLKLLHKYQDKIHIEVRTTITPTLVSRKEDVLKIAEQLQDLECTYVLKQFNPANTKRRFAEIKPPSIEFLENLKSTLQNRYPNFRVVLESMLS